MKCSISALYYFKITSVEKCFLMARLPKNLSNTLSFKSAAIKTGASVLEHEILGEKAYSLGMAAKTVEKTLNQFEELTGTGTTTHEQTLQQAADAVHAYFIQRELMGLSDHRGVIEFYKIPQIILSQVGAKIKSAS